MKSPTSRFLCAVFLAGALPVLANGQNYYDGCTPLANETWAGLADAINHSYIIASLCPFRISGEGCPTTDKYPDGIVLGRGNNEVTIVECYDITNRFGAVSTNTQCIVDCPGRHFTVASSSRGLILSNLVLRGATNTSIFVEPGANLQVGNMIFYNNSAGDNNGGAIAAPKGSSVDIEFSTFTDNRGVFGGAVYIRASNLTLKKSIFSKNQANSAGGAVAINSASNANIEDSSFSENESLEGGAFYVSENANLSALRTVFENNYSTFGGAILTGGTATITDSTLKDNTGASGGGAIACDMGSATVLTRNTFINNRSSGYGPAVYDRYNSEVLTEANTACGNLVKIGGQVPVNRNLQCDGVYALAGRRFLRRCKPFQNECVAPTQVPTSSPQPSYSPSSQPSRTATDFPSSFFSAAPSSQPTSSPSMMPSNRTARDFPPSFSPTTPSSQPTSLPSIPPSGGPTFVPSSSPSPLPPKPSSVASAGPSSAITSDAPSFLPTHNLTSTPSIIPSDAPSMIPSDSPSLFPSGAPTVEQP